MFGDSTRQQEGRKGLEELSIVKVEWNAVESVECFFLHQSAVGIVLPLEAVPVPVGMSPGRRGGVGGGNAEPEPGARFLLLLLQLLLRL